MRQVNSWLKFIRRQFFSSPCLLCGDPGRTAYGVCRACYLELPWLSHACHQCALPLSHPGLVCGACLSRPPGFDRAKALWYYRPPVKGLIYALKFQGRQDLAWVLGGMMADRLQATPLPDCLVPVPLHPARYRTRGFNQALELARPIAKKLKIPLCPNLCRRVLDTAPQRTLAASERRKNLRGAFVATEDLNGLRIAILDDVLTTGATVHEVASTLKRAGAAHVEVWVWARA